MASIIIKLYGNSVNIGVLVLHVCVCGELDG